MSFQTRTSKILLALSFAYFILKRAKMENASRVRLALLSAVTVGFVLRQLLRSPPSKFILDPSKVGRQLKDGSDIDEYDIIIVGGGAQK